MPNRDIFCNAPWYELHIYWDGGLANCCQAACRLYENDQADLYNVKNMSIKEWMDSQPMRDLRLSMFGDDKLPHCRKCYVEEKTSTSSRRHRCNQKSVIFTKSAFAESYQQSPGFSKFEHSRINGGEYLGPPIDLHIDLGNYCNLTCKMCNPKASSKIASQYAKWGIKDAEQYIGTDWTRDQQLWEKVLDELASIPNLHNVHFMGGETLITKRFEDFVDFMIQRGRLDLNFSFVTNGTTFDETLLDKLKLFQRVGIEVSIETLDDRNAYVRQGTDQKVLIDNINRYIEFCNGSLITLTVRPAISLLTIGSYHELLEFCLEKKLIVKSLLVTSPEYLDARLLPNEVRMQYLDRYRRLLAKHDLNSVNLDADYNESDPNQIKLIIRNQIEQCINLLSSPPLTNNETGLQKMVEWCARWDNVYGYNAKELYPELSDIFDRYGY